MPLVGGFLLDREGRGNLMFEISAVLLLVLATLVPITSTSLPDLNSLVSALLGGGAVWTAVHCPRLERVS